MSIHAADDSHEFVVAPELAEVAERPVCHCTLVTACDSRSLKAAGPTTVQPGTSHGLRPGSARSLPTTSTSLREPVTS